MAKGRLAPSPTGAQHLGNARTYLLAYWAARQMNADLVMRIEDIDSPRVKPWASQQAIDDLHWLGIDWEEGPDIGGANGPYVQTQRFDLYQHALEKLIESNRVFPCTCSRKDIAAAASAPHEAGSATYKDGATGTKAAFAHEGVIYPGTCAKWQVGDTLPPAGSFCWRFRSSDRMIDVVDLVMGHEACNPARQLGAFPITQKNGKMSYQLAVVVDDAMMGITDVVRGGDLIASAFRQIDLRCALDEAGVAGYAEPGPRFAHVPMVTGPDGRRLAKRHGDTRLSYFREQGASSEQIVGWAAYSAGIVESDEPIQAHEVISHFDWDKLHQQDVVVDAAVCMSRWC